MNDNPTPDDNVKSRKVKSRNEPNDPGDGTGELFPSTSPRHSRTKEDSDHHRPTLQAGVYLWLCCEGWMRFGPFEWLRFEDTESAIIGPAGEVVAKKLDGYWRVPGGKSAGMPFSNPTITAGPDHPHRNSGTHPKRK